MKVFYEDKNLIVVEKPAGVESQSSGGFDEDMVSLIRKHLPDTGKEPYVGVVHRLDRMVSGVMVYALDPKTAAELSAQVAGQGLTKTYQAILAGIPRDKKGELRDYLVKDGAANVTKVCDAKTKGAREAVLRYKVLENKYVGGRQYARVEIELVTGRHHQIRAQFGSRGWPVVGDAKYGYQGDPEPIALAATELRFIHPKSRKEMRFRYDWNRNICQ